MNAHGAALVGKDPPDQGEVVVEAPGGEVAIITTGGYRVGGPHGPPGEDRAEDNTGNA